MKLKHALIAANIKRRKENRSSNYISFSYEVGHFVSATERITENKNGKINCDFAFIINKKYDFDKYGSKRICISKTK